MIDNNYILSIYEEYRLVESESLFKHIKALVASKCLYEAVKDNNVEDAASIIESAPTGFFEDLYSKITIDYTIDNLIHSNNTKMLNLLFNNNIDRFIDTYYLVLLSIQEKNIEMVELLADHGVFLEHEDSRFIEEAIYQDCMEIVEIILDEEIEMMNWDAEARDILSGYSEILIECDNIDTIKIVLNKVPDINIADGYILEIAIKKCCIEIIEFLIHEGASVRKPGLLFIAAKLNKWDIVDLLVNYGARLSDLSTQEVEYLLEENISIYQRFYTPVYSKVIQKAAI